MLIELYALGYVWSCGGALAFSTHFSNPRFACKTQKKGAHWKDLSSNRCDGTLICAPSGRVFSILILTFFVLFHCLNFCNHSPSQSTWNTAFKESWEKTWFFAETALMPAFLNMQCAQSAPFGSPWSGSFRIFRCFEAKSTSLTERALNFTTRTTHQIHDFKVSVWQGKRLYLSASG